MAKIARHQSFSVKARKRLGSRAQLTCHHLYGHVFVQAELGRMVDGTHSAFTKGAYEPVFANARADHLACKVL